MAPGGARAPRAPHGKIRLSAAREVKIAADGHHLVNRSGWDALYIEVGDRKADDEVDYPDIDLLIHLIDGKQTYVHKDGAPY